MIKLKGQTAMSLVLKQAVCIYIYMCVCICVCMCIIYIQGVSGGIINILEGGSTEYSE
jgi:preprotein translocase subunit SecG